MDSSCKLSDRKCVPCRGGVPPLKGEKLQELFSLLGNGWSVMNEHHLEKEFVFTNFKQALDFTNTIGEIAEEEDHHPDILLSYGKVTIQLWTHKINGLSESDFVLAAKCDEARKTFTPNSA